MTDTDHTLTYERLRMALQDIGENPDAVRYVDEWGGKPGIDTCNTVGGPTASVEAVWRAFTVIGEASVCLACWRNLSSAGECGADRPFTLDCGKPPTFGGT